MCCGTPVLCSNTSSLPELAADAAITVDPLEVNAIASGMIRLANDPMARADLIGRGYIQAARFTWETAAEQTLHALIESASSKKTINN